ncbi:MAG: cation:proton antiporter [Candidatus Rokubacteria bacterium]|nr:cation:proton antiporter [Candidatus Rokubacteria bacterium]
MPELPFFRDLVLAIAAALVGGAAAQRLGQPPILGYLVGGILIGPYTPGPVSEIRHVATLADIGVVLLMFELGVEFPVARLRRVRAVAIGGGLLQVVLTGAVAMGVARAMGFPMIQQVFFGAIVALSSTLVVLKLLLDRGEMDTPHGEITVGICLVQDLTLIAMMVLLPAWAAAGEEVGRPLLLALGWALVLFIGAYFVAGLVLPALFAAVARLRSRELFLLAVVLAVIGTTVALSALGLSTALGAYLAGVVVSRSHYSRQVLAELVPSRDLFASLFFVSVGMLVDPLLLWRHLGTLLAIVAVITLLKAAIAALIVRVFGYAGSEAILTGLLLAQVGELSFVLAKLGVDRAFISGELYGLLLGGALLSILLNPALLRHGAPWVLRRWGRSPAPSSLAGAAGAETSRLADHVVICGCGRVGSELVAQLRARGIPSVVIELNPIRVEELQRQGQPCLFGDANNLHILTAAGIERARLLAITHYDAAASEATIKAVLRLHPSLKIIARVHRAADLQRLRSAGASEVVMPEFEAGMEFLRWTLGHLGLTAAEGEAIIQRRRSEFKPSETIGDSTMPGTS